MKRPRILSLLAFCTLSVPASAGDAINLIDFSRVDPSSLKTNDASANLRVVNSRHVLRIATRHAKRWPGVAIKAPDSSWDLSKNSYLCVSLRNTGARRVTIYCRIDNPGADGTRNCITERVTLEPGDRGEALALLSPKRFSPGDIQFLGMRGAPPIVARIDPARITSVVLFVADPEHDHEFEVEKIRAGGRSRSEMRLTTKTFFPFIDELGQYAHAEWPGKTHSVDELATRVSVEARELDSAPRSSDWNRYGGWASGPQRKATGYFRVENYRDKWWLVDPDGRLFWSHGVDCVHPNSPTPIRDREHYFRELPPPSSKLAQFYGRASWAPRGYYRDHSPYRTFDFFRANQLRKHGDDWNTTFIDVTHRRLESWGFNTIGNWSDREVLRARRTPYVATLSTGEGPRLAGSKGHWVQFPDVFSPGFGQALAARLEREKGGSIGDPWCIGFFVDNELSWGDETSLAIATLLSPPEQPGKRAFVADLEKKYGTIDKLNATWETQHLSWDDLLRSRKAPAPSGARDDLRGFYRRVAETYFRKIRDALREAAPGQLYLGCRFAWVNDTAARTAAKFCDVVSYNRYAYSVAGLRLPPGSVDRPLIVGEFHFGALDRGLFHTGLRKAKDQEHRAQLYEGYVVSALEHPAIVGTHWFQWKDQATTGRGDGENYQIGFIDVCDRPYPEIVRAAQSVAKRLYARRLATADAERR